MKRLLSYRLFESNESDIIGKFIIVDKKNEFFKLFYIHNYKIILNVNQIKVYAICYNYSYVNRTFNIDEHSFITDSNEIEKYLLDRSELKNPNIVRVYDDIKKFLLDNQKEIYQKLFKDIKYSPIIINRKIMKL